MKRCPHCNQTKSETEFGRSKSTRDGLTSYCRECTRAKCREWNRENYRPVENRQRSIKGTGRPLFMARTATCPECGTVFGPKVSPGGQIISPTRFKYCSRRCAYAAQSTGRTTYSKVCGVCSSRFVTFSRDKKYCSAECINNRPNLKEMTHRKRAWRAIKAEQCEHCGKTGRLHHHHKDRDITNNDPSNLAILCPKCHAAEHIRMGDRRGRNPKINERDYGLLRNLSLSHRDLGKRLKVSPSTIRIYRLKLGIIHKRKVHAPLTEVAA